MPPTVIDLVSDGSDDEEKKSGDDVKKPTPKRQPQGWKRKIEASKKEPNRKNPWKPGNNTQWNKWSSSPARRVSPELGAKNDDEVVVLDEPPKFAAASTKACTKIKPEAPLASSVTITIPPRIWWESDSAIVTHGMLPILRNLKTSSNASLILSNVDSVAHIQQNDQWSCGFRNIQMLMSALIPLLDSSHPYFQSMAYIYAQQVPGYLLTSSTPLLILPSLTQLQQQIESCWKEGFDPEGATHFRHSIVGRPSRIGAVEVGFVFAYWWLDVCVVQFIKVFQSRRLLAPFVYRYFCSREQNTRERATSCLEWAEKVYRDKDVNEESPQKKNGDSTILPVYLQWEGHSVTVVGIEPPPSFAASGGCVRNTNWSQWNLLVFCPNHKCSRLTPTNTTVAPFRLSCRTLLQKDCQLLLCGREPLTDFERMERQQSAHAITAAKEVVMDFAGGTRGL